MGCNQGKAKQGEVRRERVGVGFGVSKEGDTDRGERQRGDEGLQARKKILERTIEETDTKQVDRTVGCFVNKLSASRQAKFSSSPSLSYDGRTRAHQPRAGPITSFHS